MTRRPQVVYFLILVPGTFAPANTRVFPVAGTDDQATPVVMAFSDLLSH
jgi:hypothetical protein